MMGIFAPREIRSNALCQCVGAPISILSGKLMLDGDDSPLEDTYKAMESIHLGGHVIVAPETTVQFIATEVTLDLMLDVNLNAQFNILSSGCE